MKHSENRSQKSKVSGFTIIETIMTLAVLSIAAVGVLSVFAAGAGGGSNPLLIDQAIGLAQGELDEVLGEKSADGFSALATGSALGCTTTMLPGFTCVRSVYFVNAADLNTAVAGPTAYKHVAITISQASLGSVSADSVMTNY